MSLIIKEIEKDYMPKNRTINFRPGDTVKVHFKIKEGDKERSQIFEGTVIAIKNDGLGKSFTVRKISHGVGVERIFPLYSPVITKIEVTRHGKVRRAKLYYLRKIIGEKASRVKEIIMAKNKNVDEKSDNKEK